jgi:hypothetical protein
VGVLDLRPLRQDLLGREPLAGYPGAAEAPERYEGITAGEVSSAGPAIVRELSG